MKFGAHVGSSGGVSKSVLNAMDIGANSFALFLRSPRQWAAPPLSSEDAEKFKALCSQHGYDPARDVLPHGSYMINMANPDDEKAEKSFGLFLDDLQRCEKLGIGLYNFHPGSVIDGEKSDGLEKLASYINRAIKETSTVKIVIENMAGHGNLIGSDLQDIKTVIDFVTDKSRVGVCVDTCHSFAAGYDISTELGYKEFWDKFDSIIGRQYLSAIHLNDSKAPLAANRDLHQKLGLGYLGLDVFRFIANDPKLEGLPIVLETPVKDDDTVYGEEIKLLEWLQGRKDDEEYAAKREALAKLGASERKEQMEKFEKKSQKSKKTVKTKRQVKIDESPNGTQKKRKVTTVTTAIKDESETTTNQ